MYRSISHFTTRINVVDGHINKVSHKNLSVPSDSLPPSNIVQGAVIFCSMLRVSRIDGAWYGKPRSSGTTEPSFPLCGKSPYCMLDLMGLGSECSIALAFNMKSARTLTLLSILHISIYLILLPSRRHACNPTLHEPCTWSSHCHGDGPWSGRMPDEKWEELITEGTALYNRWVEMMDDISQYLEWLQDEGVEVLFRPLHEMNQGW